MTLISANPIPRGLTSSALLEVIPPLPQKILLAGPQTGTSSQSPWGGPLLGDGPVNPSAAFQKGHGEARDRSHTVQNISPFGRTLAPRQNSLRSILILQPSFIPWPVTDCTSRSKKGTNLFGQPASPGERRSRDLLGHSTWIPSTPAGPFIWSSS